MVVVQHELFPKNQGYFECDHVYLTLLSEELVEIEISVTFGNQRARKYVQPNKSQSHDTEIKLKRQDTRDYSKSMLELRSKFTNQAHLEKNRMLQNAQKLFNFTQLEVVH